MKHKRPNPNSRFAYARIPGERGVLYRLSRRAFNGTLHFSQATMVGSRHDFAKTLWAMRRELLERVDAIEMQLMGVT